MSLTLRKPKNPVDEMQDAALCVKFAIFYKRAVVSVFEQFDELNWPSDF